MADVCVFGLGYVGLPTATLLANAGCRVHGVDVSPTVVRDLNEGRTALKEAGLATVVSAAVRSGNLVAAMEPAPADVFIVCVPTPATADRRVDLSAVEAATGAIVPLLRRGNLVVLESTSPVGTTRNVVGRVLRGSGLEPGGDFHLCYCPERVLPGSTVRELVANSRIIGGCTPRCAAQARRLYERFCSGVIRLTDDRTAELCKLMENTCRDVNIALANVFARIAERAGTDVWRAIELANLHPRVEILRPGPGVGGHCIPVDPWFLIEQFPGDTALLRTAREINDAQAGLVLERMMESGGLARGEKLAVLGVAYKADIDDARESPAFRLAAAAAGCDVRTALHDPYVEPGEHGGFAVGRDLDECLRDAAAAVLVTDHALYRALAPETLARAMPGRLIADCHGGLDAAAFEAAGFRMLRTGVGTEPTAL